MCGDTIASERGVDPVESLYESMRRDYGEGDHPAIGSPVLIQLHSPGETSYFFRMPEFKEIRQKIDHGVEILSLKGTKVLKLSFQKKDGLHIPMEEVPQIERQLSYGATLLSGDYVTDLLFEQFLSAAK